MGLPRAAKQGGLWALALHGPSNTEAYYCYGYSRQGGVAISARVGNIAAKYGHVARGKSGFADVIFAWKRKALTWNCKWLMPLLKNTHKI